MKKVISEMELTKIFGEGKKIDQPVSIYKKHNNILTKDGESFSDVSFLKYLNHGIIFYPATRKIGQLKLNIFIPYENIHSIAEWKELKNKL